MELFFGVGPGHHRYSLSPVDDDGSVAGLPLNSEVLVYRRLYR